MASCIDCVLHLSHLVVCKFMGFAAVSIVYILYHMCLYVYCICDNLHVLMMLLKISVHLFA